MLLALLFFHLVSCTQYIYLPFLHHISQLSMSHIPNSHLQTAVISFLSLSPNTLSPFPLPLSSDNSSSSHWYLVSQQHWKQSSLAWTPINRVWKSYFWWFTCSIWEEFTSDGLPDATFPICNQGLDLVLWLGCSLNVPPQNLNQVEVWTLSVTLNCVNWLFL